jgi:hypothetical protein
VNEIASQISLAIYFMGSSYFRFATREMEFWRDVVLAEATAILESIRYNAKGATA